MPELFLVREQDVAHFASFRALRSILAPDLFKMPKKCLMGCTNKPPCVSLCLRHHQMGDKMDSLSLVLSPRAPPGPRAMHIRTSVHPPPDGGKRLIRQSLPAPRPFHGRGGGGKGREGLSGAVDDATASFLRSRERDSRLHKSRDSDGSKHQSLVD